jgi:hypothetical protein
MEGETEERESMGDGLPFPLGLVELFLRVGGFCRWHESLEEFLAVKDCVSVTYGSGGVRESRVNLRIFFAPWWVRRSCLCEANGSNSEP